MNCFLSCQKDQLLILIALTMAGCNPGMDDSPISPMPPITSDPYDWSIQISGTGESFKDVHFVDDNFGWAVGNNLVSTTSNGGITWPQAPLNASNAVIDHFNSVFFINGQKGWMVGTDDESHVGKIFVSEQGGAYPTLLETFSYPFNKVFFLDDQTGWAVGNNGQLVNTLDGGVKWNQLDNLNSNLYDVHFTSSENGWVVGDNGALYHTRDGINFQLQDLGNTETLKAIYFADSLHGWICGNNNIIYRSNFTDEHQLFWTLGTIPEASLTNWNDIHFIDPLNGWVIGATGNIYNSIDGGSNWIRQTSPAIEDLNAIHMNSNTSGWIAGDNGIILAYTP